MTSFTTISSALTRGQRSLPSMRQRLRRDPRSSVIIQCLRLAAGIDPRTSRSGRTWTSYLGRYKGPLHAHQTGTRRYCVLACVHTRAHVCVVVYVCARACAHMHVCAHARVCTCTCAHARVYVHTRAHARLCTCTCAHMHVCTHEEPHPYGFPPSGADKGAKSTGGRAARVCAIVHW